MINTIENIIGAAVIEASPGGGGGGGGIGAMSVGSTFTIA